MKNLIWCLLLVCLQAMAKDIPVAAGGSISNACAAAVSGDRVVVAAGTFTERIHLKPGVSIIGAGVGKTVINNFTFDWWKGAIDLATGDGGGQVLQGFTLQGDPNRSFEGIRINRSNVTVRDVSVSGFYYSGIEVQSDFEKPLTDVLIENFSVSESSKESTAGSFGNIILRGELRRVVVKNGTITHLTNNAVGPYGEKSSGYGIKAFSNWANGGFSAKETQSDCKIQNIVFRGKRFAPWGPNVPNFNVEVWNVHVENFEISGCDFNMQLSLEHGLQKAVHRSFWVHGNNFNVERGQSIELTASHSLVERNVFKFAANDNPWNFIGTYNAQPSLRDIAFRNNIVDFGPHSPAIVCAQGQYVNLVIENNLFRGTGNPTLVWFRTGSAGSTIRFAGNTLPDKFTQVRFESVTAAQVFFQFTPAALVQPQTPKADTVYVERLVVKTDTVRMTKTDTVKVFLPAPYPVYYDPVLHYDSASGQYIIRRQIRK